MSLVGEAFERFGTESGVSGCVSIVVVSDDTMFVAATASWCGDRRCNVQRCRAVRGSSPSDRGNGIRGRESGMRK